MFTSLPSRMLSWSAGAAGRSSPNRVPAPPSRNVTSHTPQNFVVRVALPCRRRICVPSFSLDSLRLDRPDANGLGLLRAGSSGEEWCTPRHTVPVSPQCPQEIGLLTLPVFQGAAVSSKHFFQSLPPVNVAELRGSPPVWGSLEQLERPSPAFSPLQSTELAALSTPEASFERLFPLVDYLAAWKLLSMSLCLPPFNRVTPTLVGPEQALLREQEMSTLLRKEAIKLVSPLDKEFGFYSRTSLFVGKGLCHFWETSLRHWTKVQKSLFEQVVSHTRSENWCHVRSRRCILLPHHRKFLRSALGAKRINIGFFPSALHSRPY